MSVHHYTSPSLFTKNNKLWNERKGFFVYVATSVYRVISKEEENHIFSDNNIFRHVYVKTAHIDKQVELQ